MGSGAAHGGSSGMASPMRCQWTRSNDRPSGTCAGSSFVPNTRYSLVFWADLTGSTNGSPMSPSKTSRAASSFRFGAVVRFAEHPASDRSDRAPMSDMALTCRWRRLMRSVRLMPAIVPPPGRGRGPSTLTIR